jgi:hypothetical protein
MGSFTILEDSVISYVLVRFSLYAFYIQQNFDHHAGVISFFKEAANIVGSKSLQHSAFLYCNDA